VNGLGSVEGFLKHSHGLLSFVRRHGAGNVLSRPQISGSDFRVWHAQAGSLRKPGERPGLSFREEHQLALYSILLDPMVQNPSTFAYWYISGSCIFLPGNSGPPHSNQQQVGFTVDSADCRPEIIELMSRQQCRDTGRGEHTGLCRHTPTPLAGRTNVQVAFDPPAGKMRKAPAVTLTNGLGGS
jgi:hypothetical protein